MQDGGPRATYVVGMRTRNELGRPEKHGEKGIAILVPVIGTRRKMQEKDSETEEAGRTPKYNSL